MNWRMRMSFRFPTTPHNAKRPVTSRKAATYSGGISRPVVSASRVARLPTFGTFITRPPFYMPNAALDAAKMHPHAQSRKHRCLCREHLVRLRCSWSVSHAYVVGAVASHELIAVDVVRHYVHHWPLW